MQEKQPLAKHMKRTLLFFSPDYQHIVKPQTQCGLVHVT